ncbi:MAG: glycosyltransferase family 2 protein [Gemmatimonas sp.]|nr:glycosyltransferase family 2 protein [Gemmatimonas sp.]
MRTVSIVVPVYYNALNLPTTIPELLALEERMSGHQLELVFVDDGSGDDSLAVLREFQGRHPDKITVVKLTRNFGSMAAIQAAMSVASGECVGMIAADLQDPPELFLEMLRMWEQGQKAVFAVRADREESFGQKLFANSYYALIRRFAIRDYPSGGFDFFLIDRQVVNEVCRVSEKNTNLMTLIFWLGFPHVAIPYVRRARRAGKSRWTLSKKIKLVIDSFVAFSYVPVRAVSLTGLVFALIAFTYGLIIIYDRLRHGTDVRGWPSMAALVGRS